ncbi:hypothetical protein Tco_0202080 [Tanacetum coccineum]
MVGKHKIHLIPKGKDGIAVVKTRYTVFSTIVKNVEIDGMTHVRKDDLEMEYDLRVLEEHPRCHQQMEDEAVPKVDDVSLVDGVFDGAFGGDGDEDFVMRDGVVVSSYSWVKCTKSFLGGMMVNLIFLEGLDEEAWVEAMKE